MVEDVGYTLTLYLIPQLCIKFDNVDLWLITENHPTKTPSPAPNVVIIVVDDNHDDRLGRLLWQVSTPPVGLAACVLKIFLFWRCCIGWL